MRTAGLLLWAGCVFGQETAIRMDATGVSCQTPCHLFGLAGTMMRLAAPSLVREPAVARKEVPVAAATASAAVLPAVDRPIHRVQTVAIPPLAATFSISRSSEPGDPEGSATVRVHPTRGYRLKRWEGDASGSNPEVRLSVNRSFELRAILEPTPWVDPAGIANAAGPTLDHTVAPGARAVIRGLNLASSALVADSNPLPSVLDQVAIRWQDRLLPLLAVTPEAVHFLLPTDLPEGPFTVQLRRTGYPALEVSGQAVRLAPGLFAQWTEEPQGITVLFATGLGRYDFPVAEGFLTPADSHAAVLEPVAVLADGVAIAPKSATAAPGHAGLTAIRVMLPPGVRELRVQAGGRVSNAIAK